VFLGRSPDAASNENEDVRRFQLHPASDGISLSDDPKGTGRLEVRTGFMSNPAGAAISTRLADTPDHAGRRRHTQTLSRHRGRNAGTDWRAGAGAAVVRDQIYHSHSGPQYLATTIWCGPKDSNPHGIMIVAVSTACAGTDSRPRREAATMSPDQTTRKAREQRQLRKK
jgi:hypothetical protein